MSVQEDSREKCQTAIRWAKQIGRQTPVQWQWMATVIECPVSSLAPSIVRIRKDFFSRLSLIGHVIPDKSWNILIWTLSSSVKGRLLWWSSRSLSALIFFTCIHQALGSSLAHSDGYGECPLQHKKRVFWRDESTNFLYSQSLPNIKESKRKRRKKQDVLFLQKGN